MFAGRIRRENSKRISKIPLVFWIWVRYSNSESKPVNGCRLNLLRAYAASAAQRRLISFVYEGEFRMNHWTNGTRWLSLALALTMVLSLLCVSASATTLDEARKSLANVVITQEYGTKQNNTAVKNNAVHDYRTDGSDVFITYKATLNMTDTMATYLQARQTQLYDAQFHVNMNVELDWLDWTATGDKLTFTFKSTFLKPKQPDRATDSDYSFKLEKHEGNYFTYTITASKVWIQQNWKAGQSFSVPMELIYYYDGTTAYGFDNVPDEAKAKGVSAMFWNYDKTDWMAGITLELASLKVNAQKAATITTSFSKTIKASGTVDGRFSYIKVDVPTDIANAKSLAAASDKAAGKDWTSTLAFGNENDIKEWKSNEVTVTLKYSSGGTTIDPTPTPGGDKEPSDLNITDHFAYIIGYPDGEVKPTGNVTRAEVATIFFRMLKDEARNKYWCTTNRYSDVNSNNWFNNAVSTLSNMGIIDGYPDGSFRPNAGITRAEFAKIAVSFFKDYVGETIGDRFTDISGKWYTTYINLAAELAIVNGYPDGTFRPDNKITRAEAMQIVNNTLRRTPHKDHLLPESSMNMWPDNPRTAWYYAAVQEATNSHEYQRASVKDYEQWLAKLPERDWAAFERAWSDANSAPNPGEVVDGSNSYLDRD